MSETLREASTEKRGSKLAAYLKRIAGLQSKSVKRYNLAIPQPLFDELQRIAEERGTTVVEILRRSIKLGLIAAYIEEEDDAGLFIREGNTEKELLFM